jgi:hypothetical protein
MSFRVNHRDEMLASVLTGGFCRAQPDYFLHGSRQIIYLKK